MTTEREWYNVCNVYAPNATDRKLSVGEQVDLLTKLMARGYVTEATHKLAMALRENRLTWDAEGNYKLR